MLDLCGCEPFLGMQGESLLPILEDPATQVRDHVYIEDDFPDKRVRFLPSRMRSLVTEEGRITRYSSGEVEVFDLEKDPDEMTNLAAKPGGRERREHLSDRLTDALLRYQDDSPGGPLPAV